MKFGLWSALVGALALFAAPALAADNPFYAAYHGDVTVTDVAVTYTDGILESHSDRAAQSFVANDDFPSELRAEFDAFAATKGALSTDNYGERFSEFLLARSLRASGVTLTGSRRVRVEVDVTDARINGLISGAFFGGAAFPRLGGTVRVFDSESGALMATAQISNSQSWAVHNEAAEEQHGLRYNFSGTDTNFRLLAGSTEAMRINVMDVLRAPGFRDRNQQIVLSTYPTVRVRPPVITVTLAPQ